MVNFVNFNLQLRNMLEKKYINLKIRYDKFEVGTKYYEFIENLKTEYPELYQTIIGLCFTDHYRILLHLKEEKQITNEGLDTLDLYNQIDDMDDLNILLEEHPDLIFDMIFGSFKFKSFTIKGQACLISQLSDEKAFKFNKFSVFEKYNIFRKRELEDFIILYKNTINSNPEDIILRKFAIIEILNILDLLLSKDVKNFQEIILKMTKIYYKWKKFLQAMKPDLIFGNDKEIIDLIENTSLDDILHTLAYNEEYLQIVIEDFLEYETNSIINKVEVEEQFEQLAPHDVKIKLKEV